VASSNRLWVSALRSAFERRVGASVEMVIRES
jgi:hypothetical protein